MISDTLYVLGDSIARGVIFDNDKMRYTLCRNTFDTSLTAMGVQVKNYSKMGCTSVSALDIMNRCGENKGAIAAIEFGGNDSDLNWKSVSENPNVFHEAAVSIEEYSKSLKKMIAGLRQKCMRPVVVTPLPVVPDRYFQKITENLDANAIMHYLGNEFTIYRWQERYAHAAFQTAREEKCPVFDLRGLFLNRLDFESLMCADGIHPNEKGHGVIAEAVKKLWKQGLQ